MKNIEIVNRLLLKKIYKKRPEWSHKGDFGHLLVIGGSKKYSGSPAFNTLAAYRSGVDLVTVVAPKRAANIIATFSPDMITYPLEGDYLKKTFKRNFRINRRCQCISNRWWSGKK